MENSNYKIGDIAKGSLIGKRDRDYYELTECLGCGKTKWVFEYRTKQKKPLCQSCAGFRNEVYDKNKKYSRGDVIIKKQKSGRWRKFICVECTECHNLRWIYYENFRNAIFKKYAYFLMCRCCFDKISDPRKGNWNTGKYITKDGYVTMQIPQKHPDYDFVLKMKQPRTKISCIAILEHRYVMAKHLGRPLRDDEIIDHLDGDRANNKINNLRVTTPYGNNRARDKYHEGFKDGMRLFLVYLICQKASRKNATIDNQLKLKFD